MSTPRQLDAGAYIAEAVGIRGGAVAATSTVGSAGFPNTVAINGITIDRLALSRRYLSAKAEAIWYGARESTGLGTHTIAVAVQDSADGTNWTAYSTVQAPTPLILGTTSTAAGVNTTSTNPTGVAGHRVNLLRARRYIRMVITPTISLTTAGAGDGVIAGMWAFSGAEAYPTS